MMFSTLDARLLPAPPSPVRGPTTWMQVPIYPITHLSPTKQTSSHSCLTPTPPPPKSKLIPPSDFVSFPHSLPQSPAGGVHVPEHPSKPPTHPPTTFLKALCLSLTILQPRETATPNIAAPKYQRETNKMIICQEKQTQGVLNLSNIERGG